MAELRDASEILEQMQETPKGKWRRFAETFADLEREFKQVYLEIIICHNNTWTYSG
jgi:hypothetical protein